MWKIIFRDSRGRIKKTKYYSTQKKYNKWFRDHSMWYRVYRVAGYKLVTTSRVDGWEFLQGRE